MVIDVLVELSNRNIDKVFSYLVPKNLESKIKIGICVLVPFANMKLGYFNIMLSSYVTNWF